MQNDPPALLFREISFHLIDAGRYRDAAEVMQVAIEHGSPRLQGARTYFQYLQSHAWEMTGETEKALTAIQEALKGAPDNAGLRFQEAWVYYHAHRYDEAIAAFEQVIADFENDNDETTRGTVENCRFSLSAIHVQQGDLEQGEAILLSVLQKDADNTQANNDLGYLWADQDKNLDQARTMIEKALKAEPDNAAYLDSMGWVLFRLGEYEQARKHLEEAAEIRSPRTVPSSNIWARLTRNWDFTTKPSRCGERRVASSRRSRPMRRWLNGSSPRSLRQRPQQHQINRRTLRVSLALDGPIHRSDKATGVNRTGFTWEFQSPILTTMAGHSHWANIAHKKGRIDAKKGKLFGKLSRAIIVAARNGGGDPDMNLALRYAIDKARKNSMPRDNIDRAIKKGCGETGDDDYTEITYEGYGPGGVAVLCDALTENRNRTAGEVRKTFEVYGGNLGSTGCVSWMFERRGLFTVPVEQTDDETIFEIGVEAGADDVKRSGTVFEIICPPEDFQQVAAALESRGLETDVAELTRIPASTVDLDANDSRRVLRLLEALEDNEDVQNVTANFNISEEIMAEVMSESS